MTLHATKEMLPDWLFGPRPFAMLRAPKKAYERRTSEAAAPGFSCNRILPALPTLAGVFSHCSTCNYKVSAVYRSACGFYAALSAEVHKG